MMLGGITGIELSDLGVSQKSLELCGLLVEASNLEAELFREGRPLACDEGALDARFEAIQTSVLELPESLERGEAISRLWRLWSLTSLRYVALRPSITMARITHALVDAQIAACWAAGDADKV